MSSASSGSQYIPDALDPSLVGKKRRRQRMKERAARQSQFSNAEPTAAEYAAKAQAELIADLAGDSHETKTGMLFKSLACMFQATETPVAADTAPSMDGVLRQSTPGRGRSRRRVCQTFAWSDIAAMDVEEPT